MHVERNGPELFYRAHSGLEHNGTKLFYRAQNGPKLIQILIYMTYQVQ